MKAKVPLVLLCLSLMTAVGTASPPAPKGPKALFFGDSLIGGSGAIPKRPVEPRTVADLMGWDPIVDSFGGTGYTTGGPHGKPFLQRFRHDHYLDRRYDVVVLEGGTNDAWFGHLDRLHDAAVTVVDYVKVKQPTARIVMVGGYAPYGIDHARYEQMDATLAAVAQEEGLQYVSQLPFSQVSDKGFLSKDHYHPSDLGYGAMGRALAKAIKTSS